MPEEKACTKCGEVKNFSEFYLKSSVKSKLSSQCKICTKEAVDIYRLNNRSKVNEAKRKHWKEHREELLVRRKNQDKVNSEHVKVRRAKYYLENKDKINSRIKVYVNNNQEKVAARRKLYRDNNKEK